MSSHEFDLITIGAGSGGVAASRYAASKGARVAICEALEIQRSVGVQPAFHRICVCGIGKRVSMQHDMRGAGVLE